MSGMGWLRYLSHPRVLPKSLTSDGLRSDPRCVWLTEGGTPMQALTGHPTTLIVLVVLAATIVGLWFAANKRDFDERLDAYLG